MHNFCILYWYRKWINNNQYDGRVSNGIQQTVCSVLLTFTSSFQSRDVYPPEVIASVFPGCCPRLTVSLLGRVGRGTWWRAPLLSTHTFPQSPPSSTVSCIPCIPSPSKPTYTGGGRFPRRGRFPGTGLQKTIAKVQPSLTGSPVPSRAALPFAVLDA